MFKNMIEKFKSSLEKTRKNITYKMDQLFGYYDDINDEFLEELEELLILADIGFDTVNIIMEKLEDRIREDRINEPSKVKPVLKEIMGELISHDNYFDFDNPPKVILIIGINGAGKTTTIGKLSKLIKNKGNKVLLAAADTFRAAAIDQLKVWAERADVDIVHQSEGSDPASVIYDAINKSKSNNYDVLICDSAGRLHNKKNLMMELQKIKKIITREYDEKDILTLLVLDSTTGQNAINQAVEFKEYAKMDGIILTKLDGSSKGGFVFSIKEKLSMPVMFVTLGEQIDDIEVFDADSFVEGIFYDYKQ